MKTQHSQKIKNGLKKKKARRIKSCLSTEFQFCKIKKRALHIDCTMCKNLTLLNYILKNGQNDDVCILPQLKKYRSFKASTQIAEQKSRKPYILCSAEHTFINI